LIILSFRNCKCGKAEGSTNTDASEQVVLDQFCNINEEDDTQKISLVKKVLGWLFVGPLHTKKATPVISCPAWVRFLAVGGQTYFGNFRSNNNNLSKTTYILG